MAYCVPSFFLENSVSQSPLHFFLTGANQRSVGISFHFVGSMSRIRAWRSKQIQSLRQEMTDGYCLRVAHISTRLKSNIVKFRQVYTRHRLTASFL